LIERLALSVSGSRWVDPTRAATSPEGYKAAMQGLDEWRTDPFRYRAFKIAVGSLLTALEPKGEIKSPLPAELIDRMVTKDPDFFGNPELVGLMKQRFKSPETMGADAFSNLWIELNRTTPLSKEEKEILREGDWVGELIVEETYALAAARQELGLGQEEKP
jgi:hypothetical protein